MLKSCRHEPVLITGSNGVIGCKVIETLLERGFFNLRCFVRTSGKLNRLNEVLTRHPEAKIEVIEGNLLSREDCGGAVRDVPLIYRLAAGIILRRSFYEFGAHDPEPAGCCTRKRPLEAIRERELFRCLFKPEPETGSRFRRVLRNRRSPSRSWRRLC